MKKSDLRIVFKFVVVNIPGRLAGGLVAGV